MYSGGLSDSDEVGGQQHGPVVATSYLSFGKCKVCSWFGNPDLTTKGTKKHEGSPLGFNLLSNLVSFVLHETLGIHQWLGDKKDRARILWECKEIALKLLSGTRLQPVHIPLT